jgi:hypothetical protein
MIKLFRNIRQNLLMENHQTCLAGRHLKYAFGEIILVVIIQKYNLNLKTFTNRSPLGRG